jgi:hypothetical protein
MCPAIACLAICCLDTNSKVQSLRAVVALIECLGSLLQSTSFHQEKYGRLMISIVVQYYQKCHERFKGSFISMIYLTIKSQVSYLDTKLLFALRIGCSRISGNYSNNRWVQPSRQSQACSRLGSETRNHYTLDSIKIFFCKSTPHSIFLWKFGNKGRPEAKNMTSIVLIARQDEYKEVIKEALQDRGTMSDIPGRSAPNWFDPVSKKTCRIDPSL